MADPVSFGLVIAVQAGFALLMRAFQRDRQGPRLEDRSIATADYGQALGIGIGTVRMAGHVISRADLEEVRSEESAKGGPSITQFAYFWTGAVAFADREASSILQLIADGRVIFDAITEIGEDSRLPGLSFRFYRGAPTQAPDPALVEQEGDLQPGYDGVVYVVFDRFPLERFGNRIPQIEAVIAFEQQTAVQINTVFEVPTGATPFFGFAPYSGDGVYDPSRNTFYGLYRSGDGAWLLTAHDMRTGALLITRPVSELAASLFGSGGGPDLSSVHSIAGARGPFLIVQFGGGVSGAVMSVRKDTLTAASVIGRTSNSRSALPPGVDGEPTLPIAVQMTVVEIPGATDTDRFVTGGNGGILFNTAGRSFWVLRLTSAGGLEFVWGGSQFNMGGGAAAITQGEQRPEAGEVDIYFGVRQSNLSGSGPINIYRAVVRRNSLYDADNDETLFYDDPVLVHTIPRRGADGTFRMLYDSVTDRLIWAESGVVEAYDLAGDFLAWQRTDLDVVAPLRDQGAEDLQGGPFASFKGGNVELLDPVDGLTIRTQLFATSNYTSPPASPYRAQTFLWDDAFSRVVMAGDRAVLYGERDGVAGESLQTVVVELCTRGVLEAADINVTDLDPDAVVDGYRIERESDVRGLLEPLGAAYNFDGGEVGDRLQFRPRTGLPDLTIGEDELMQVREGLVLDYQRGLEIEAPIAATVSYIGDEDFQTRSQAFTLPRSPEGVSRASSSQSVSLPLKLSDDDAVRLAERFVVTADIERARVGAKSSQRYLWLAPMDVIRITRAAGDLTFRLDEVKRLGDYTVEFAGPIDAPFVHTATAIGVPPVARTTALTSLTDAVPSVTVLPLDIPLLRDSDEQAASGVLYAAALGAPSASGFQPARLFFRLGAGDVQATANGGMLEREVAWGTLSEPPPDPPDREWNSIQRESMVVQVLSGAETVSSLTLEELLATEGNRLLISRGDGSAEVVGFAGVEDLGADRLRLSTLIRGERGTDVFSYGHAPGSIVLFLQGGSALEAVAEPISRIGQSIAFGAAAIGQPSLDGAAEITIEGRSLKPYRPWSLDRQDQPDGTIRLTWRRRPRLGLIVPPPSNTPPLLEDLEQYAVEILDGSGGSVIATFMSSSAQLDIDPSSIGGAPPVLWVRISQVSSLVGRGLALERGLIN